MSCSRRSRSAKLPRRQHKPGILRPTLDARGDAVPNQRLNALLARIVERNELPGLIGAIGAGAEHGVAIGAVGLRKMGSAEPLTVNDTVHVGSCTKAMTATLIGARRCQDAQLEFHSPRSLPRLSRVYPSRLSKRHAGPTSFTSGWSSQGGFMARLWSGAANGFAATETASAGVRRGAGGKAQLEAQLFERRLRNCGAHGRTKDRRSLGRPDHCRAFSAFGHEFGGVRCARERRTQSTNRGAIDSRMADWSRSTGTTFLHLAPPEPSIVR